MRKFKDKNLQEFYDRLVAYSQKELKSWNSYDSGFSYHGQISNDPEADVVVLWHAANRSYSSIEMRALLAHYRNEFDKIKGLAWTVEWANGNGGSDWIVINLTQTATKAFREVYESFGDLWNCKDAEDFYYASDTSEYQEMYDEESHRDFLIWWQDETRGTPYSDLPESYYEYNDCLNWQSDDCYIYATQHGYPTKEAFITLAVLKALNAGDLEIDKEDYEEWWMGEDLKAFTEWQKDHRKPFNTSWPAIAQGEDGTWALESELINVNDLWVFPDRRDPEHQPKLFDE